eukprot:CAMPEP_0172494182 /NCGR_PEP_ID=MMETSP1066-20121228/39667_1 /TAXON_ID=671091 /ORGANISM="Coscinodiscus wailesii, Strain CCMP2513" /LENGTH=430 /DNA_ID=CAMNT_0013264931 /DNA_START=107 /DNA_END=1399 /DNA_ORIENTATION=-
MAHLVSLGRATTTSSRGIVNAISKRQLSYLTASEEFPGTPATTPATPSSSSPTQTTLSNGLTIITEPSSTTSTISLTFPSAGSSNETISEAGASLANKCLSFKSTADASSLAILRALETAGATPFSFAGRKGAGLGFTAASGNGEDLVGLLGAQCAFEKWDVNEALGMAGSTIDMAMGNAQTVLTESLFAAAYGAQSPLGRPFHSPATSTGAITSFRERTYVSSGAVLAATGISDHDGFVKAVEGSFDLPTGSPPSEGATPAYMGGETRVYAPGAGMAHVAVAFSAASASSTVLNVLKYCFAGNDGVESFAAPGLVGVYGFGGGDAVDALCSTLTASLSSEAIMTAKKKAKADAVLALGDGSKSLADAMTSGVLESGSFIAEAVGAAYDAVTEAEVNAALSGMLKSNPAVAAVGDISSVPYHATIAARFN